MAVLKKKEENILSNYVIERRKCIKYGKRKCIIHQFSFKEDNNNNDIIKLDDKKIARRIFQKHSIRNQGIKKCLRIAVSVFNDNLNGRINQFNRREQTRKIMLDVWRAKLSTIYNLQ